MTSKCHAFLMKYHAFLMACHSFLMNIEHADAKFIIDMLNVARWMLNFQHPTRNVEPFLMNVEHADAKFIIAMLNVERRTINVERFLPDV